MRKKNKIILFLFLMTSTFVLAQTPGFNYQALILGEQQIQIPGTDITNSNVALTSEKIILRFTITNEEEIEYIEEHTITTDENGMVSLIVGDGIPISYKFSNINWDGKLKYLKVELNILSNDLGFLLLDNQKILYVPQPVNTSTTTIGYGNVKIVNSINDITPPYNLGDLVWITNYGANENTSLLIWNGNNWLPVNEDYDAENEIGLIIVDDNLDRARKFLKPKTGNRVWNKASKCLQIFDDNSWISITTKATNGLNFKNDLVKLGGTLTEPTEISIDAINTLAIKGLQLSNNDGDQVVLVDKNTGVLKQVPLNSFASNTKSKEVIVFAIDGQLEFSTPLNITNKEKINVFRNGINIDFSVINNTTIKLEPEAICYNNDKIKIVQLN